MSQRGPEPHHDDEGPHKEFDNPRPGRLSSHPEDNRRGQESTNQRAGDQAACRVPVNTAATDVQEGADNRHPDQDVGGGGRRGGHWRAKEQQSRRNRAATAQASDPHHQTAHDAVQDTGRFRWETALAPHFRLPVEFDN